MGIGCEDIMPVESVAIFPAVSLNVTLADFSVTIFSPAVSVPIWGWDLDLSIGLGLGNTSGKTGNLIGSSGIRNKWLSISSSVRGRIGLLHILALSLWYTLENEHFIFLFSTLTFPIFDTDLMNGFIKCIIFYTYDKLTCCEY